MESSVIRRCLPYLFIPVPFLFYFFTLSPAIGLGDTALLLDGMMRCSVNSHVNNHNLTVLIGHFFMRIAPGEIAFRGNLFSAFFGALAAASFYLLALRMTCRVSVSAAATLSVMVSHSLWWHSTIVENYALNACFSVWIIISLFKASETGHERYVLAAAALSGLALFNHVQMGFWLPAIGLFILMRYRESRKTLFLVMIRASCFFVIGFLPYIAVFIRDAVRNGSLAKTFYWALGGDFQGIMLSQGAVSGLGDFLFLAALQYPSFFMILILAGVYYGFREDRYRPLFAAMAAGFCVNTYFFMRYPTWDKFAFLLPSFLILGVAGIAGLDAAAGQWLPRRRCAGTALIAAVIAGSAIPVMLYAKLPGMARDPGSFLHERYNNDYTENTHDCARYILNPDKRDYANIRDLAGLIFSKLPAGSILVDDDSRTYYPLAEYYQRYYRTRPDVTIVLINSWGFSNWGSGADDLKKKIRREVRTRPVFMISTRRPHDAIIAGLFADGIVPERFPLDSFRWICRLRPADSRPARTNLEFLGMSLDAGPGRNAGTGGADEFNIGDDIAVTLAFKRNYEPALAEFLWRDGGGRLMQRAGPLVVHPGSTRVRSPLESDFRIGGPWSVEALVDGRPVGKKGFLVREQSGSRSGRAAGRDYRRGGGR